MRIVLDAGGDKGWRLGGLKEPRNRVRLGEGRQMGGEGHTAVNEVVHIK